MTEARHKLQEEEWKFRYKKPCTEISKRHSDATKLAFVLLKSDHFEVPDEMIFMLIDDT